jgi:Protein of unknown function (DUF1232)
MSREMWILIGVVVALVAVSSLIFAIKLGKRLFLARRVLGELGTGGKVAFYGALLYTFFPIDLVPDPIYLDDIGVLAAAVGYLTHLIRQRRKRGATIPGIRRSADIHRPAEIRRESHH